MADDFHRRFFCFSKGKRCSSAPLDFNGLNKGLCELLVNGALGEYRTTECHQYLFLNRCIYKFCDDVSSCLSQTSKWRNLCFARFYWFRLGEFAITASKEVQNGTCNGTYIRNLQLGFCYKTFSYRRVKYKFSIRTTEYFYHSENQANKGMNSLRLCCRG